MASEVFSLGSSTTNLHTKTWKGFYFIVDFLIRNDYRSSNRIPNPSYLLVQQSVMCRSRAGHVHVTCRSRAGEE